MKKSRVKTNMVLFALAALSLAGCSPVYYPNAVSNPILEEKGDLSLSISGGLYGGDVQTAVAIADHFGLSLNGQYYQIRHLTDKSIHTRNIFGEVGAIGFFDFGPSGKFELMAGYGEGNLYGVYQLEGFSDNKSVIQRRACFQPTIGWKREYFSMSMGCRMVMVELQQRSVSYQKFFVEPMVTFKAGFPFMKFFAQVCCPIYAVNTASFVAPPILINVGVQFRVNAKELLSTKKEQPSLLMGTK